MHMAEWSNYWCSHKGALPLNRNEAAYTSLVHWLRGQQIEIIFIWRHFKVLYAESIRQYLLAVFHSRQWEEIRILIAFISFPVYQRLLFSMGSCHSFVWNGESLNWNKTRVLFVLLNPLYLLCLFYPLFVNSLPSSCTCCCFWSLSMPLSSIVRTLSCSPEFQTELPPSTAFIFTIKCIPFCIPYSSEFH